MGTHWRGAMNAAQQESNQAISAWKQRYVMLAKQVLTENPIPLERKPLLDSGQDPKSLSERLYVEIKQLE